MEKQVEIYQYTADIQTPLFQFYNRQTANVPHCYPVKEEEFAYALCGVTTGKADVTEGGLGSETAFVAMTDGAVQAFIHIGLGQIGENREEDIGVIRFFGYERGARQAGQAVLEKAETYLKTYNVARIFAFSSDCRYRFYHFDYACLSDALDHVQALLGFNGYCHYDNQIFFDWENYSVTPIPSSLPVTFSADWKQGRGHRPNYTVKAYQGDTKVGECDSLSGGEFSSHPHAQDWLHTFWLDIEEEYQGQGLGRYLLQYALQEMHKVGYRHATICTHMENYRAQLFYSNCGYRVVDRTYEYVKTISESSSK